MLAMSCSLSRICSMNASIWLYSRPVIGASQESGAVAAYANWLNAGNGEATGEHWYGSDKTFTLWIADSRCRYARLAGCNASLCFAIFIESLSVCISPIPQHSSLRFERLVRWEGSSESDFLAQEYMDPLGSDLIVNGSVIGVTRGYGRSNEG